MAPHRSAQGRRGHGACGCAAQLLRPQAWLLRVQKPRARRRPAGSGSPGWRSRAGPAHGRAPLRLPRPPAPAGAAPAQWLPHPRPALRRATRGSAGSSTGACAAAQGRCARTASARGSGQETPAPSSFRCALLPLHPPARLGVAPPAGRHLQAGRQLSNAGASPSVGQLAERDRQPQHSALGAGGHCLPRRQLPFEAHRTSDITRRAAAWKSAQAGGQLARQARQAQRLLEGYIALPRTPRCTTPPSSPLWSAAIGLRALPARSKHDCPRLRSLPAARPGGWACRGCTQVRAGRVQGARRFKRSVRQPEPQRGLQKERPCSAPAHPGCNPHVAQAP